MYLLHSVQNSYSQKIAIFEIETATCGNVYMSVARTNYGNEERCVVIVNSSKFLQLWRREPCSIHSDISFGNLSTWVNDSKYTYAIRGFSHGIKNPVPLANIVCQTHVENISVWRRKYLLFKELVEIKENKFEYVAFIDGVTRTIWLLSKGVECFPVECPIDGAIRLAELAGCKGRSWQTVESLIPL